MVTIFVYPDDTGAYLATERWDGRHYPGKTLEEIKEAFLQDCRDRGWVGLPDDMFKFVEIGHPYRR